MRTFHRHSASHVFTHLLYTVLCMAYACSSDGFVRQIPSLQLTPQTSSGQTLLLDPPGIDVGRVPLYMRHQALFKLSNTSSVPVELRSITNIRTEQARVSFDVRSDTGDTLEQPWSIAPYSDVFLHVFFQPTVENQQGLADIVVESNAGPTGSQTQHAYIVGSGVFIGIPSLEISYNNTLYTLDTVCNTPNTCTLPPLNMGHIGTYQTTVQSVVVRNQPAENTCLLADPQDCSERCVLSFENIRIEAEPSLYSWATPPQLPWELPYTPASCASPRNTGSFFVQLQSTDTVLQPQGKAVFNTNHPFYPVVEIPLTAQVHTRPIAIASLKPCNPLHPEQPCSTSLNVPPLTTVHLDGSQSYDPANNTPGALTSYRWSVVSQPEHAEAQVQNNSQEPALASLYLPKAGTYHLRLTVTNTWGVESIPTASSDLFLEVLPNTSFSVQLYWSDAESDLDLHLVNAQNTGRVYHSKDDCFWLNCSPQRCPANSTCNPVRWFEQDLLYEGANPRLDTDDTQGLGPETLNLSRPRPGHYHVYVHYYNFVHTQGRASTAVVKVFALDMLVAEHTRVLYPGDLWAVTDVEWQSNTDVVLHPAQSDRTNESGSVQQLTYLPYPEGFSSNARF